VSSFDDTFGPPPAPDPEAFPASVRPEWIGPPTDELGCAVPCATVLARNERAVVGLRALTVFSAGLALDVVAVARGLRPAEASRVMHEQHAFAPDDDVSPLMLRIGVTFADGRRASNLGGHHRLFASGEPPDEPVLFPAGGGGGMSSGTDVSLQPSYWLWPLPPGDELRLACEWPALDLPFREHVLDAAALREAAARSLPLW